MNKLLSILNNSEATLQPGFDQPGNHAVSPGQVLVLEDAWKPDIPDPGPQMLKRSMNSQCDLGKSLYAATFLPLFATKSHCVRRHIISQILRRRSCYAALDVAPLGAGVPVQAEERASPLRQEHQFRKRTSSNCDAVVASSRTCCCPVFRD